MAQILIRITDGLFRDLESVLAGCFLNQLETELVVFEELPTEHESSHALLAAESSQGVNSIWRKRQFDAVMGREILAEQGDLLLNLSGVDFVVLDEADEMLSMGFKEDLESILAKVPASHQTMLFSATMSDDMKGMTSSMHEPHRISVAPKNKGADTVKHRLYTVHARDRYDALKRITDYHPSIYAIVFCRTRRETKEVANKLTRLS